MIRLAKLLGIASIATLLLAPAAAGRVIATSPRPDAVVVDHHAGLLVVDPTTGTERWRLDAHNGIVGAVAAGGLIYASTAAADGSGTDLYAIPVAAAEPEIIARVPGRALVKSIAADGSQLLLMKLPAPDPDGFFGPPTGLERVSLPEHWRPTPLGSLSQRDVDLGLLAPDGQRWYELRPQEAAGGRWGPCDRAGVGRVRRFGWWDGNVDAPPASRRLWLQRGAPCAGRERALRRRLLRPSDPHHRPDPIGHRQNSRLRALRDEASALRRCPLAPRRPPNSGSTNAGDGILTYDTTSWRLMNHHLMGRDFYCLALSADGERLYATESISPQLVTIEAATGRELRSVSLNLGDCCVYLSTTAGATDIDVGDST